MRSQAIKSVLALLAVAAIIAFMFRWHDVERSEPHGSLGLPWRVLI